MDWERLKLSDLPIEGPAVVGSGINEYIPKMQARGDGEVVGTAFLA